MHYRPLIVREVSGVLTDCIVTRYQPVTIKIW